MRIKMCSVKHGDWYLLLDEEDAWVLNFGLGLWKDSKREIPYVVFQNSKRNIHLRGKKLSRVLLDCPDNFIVDHINGNPMDNQRANLRITSQANNNKNAKKRRNSLSRYKGVCPSNKRGFWKAQIQSNYKKYAIGIFPSEEKAAEAYDKKALELFGEFAKLNYPKK